MHGIVPLRRRPSVSHFDPTGITVLEWLEGQMEGNLGTIFEFGRIAQFPIRIVWTLRALNFFHRSPS